MGISVIFLLLVMGIIYKSQEKAILFGKKIPINWLPTLEYSHEEFFVEVASENKKTIKLNGVLFKSGKEVGKKLILYFHGNKGNMETVEEYAISFLENGYDVFIMDYRGFGKSGGIINNPHTLLEDSIFWYDWIKEQKGYSNIVIVGKSLGSGLATYVASKRPSDMLMLITPYDKLVEVGQNLYPWFPVKFFMKYQIPSVSWLDKIQVPIRIIHGTRDETIHPQRARTLYEKAKELNKDVEIIWLNAGKHDNLQMYPQYHKWIQKSLETVEEKKINP
jgi:uncharacterized protein